MKCKYVNIGRCKFVIHRKRLGKKERRAGGEGERKGKRHEAQKHVFMFHWAVFS